MYWTECTAQHGDGSCPGRGTAGGCGDTCGGAQPASLLLRPLPSRLSGCVSDWKTGRRWLGCCASQAWRGRAGGRSSLVHGSMAPLSPREPLRSPHAPSVLGAVCAQRTGRGSSAAGVRMLCFGKSASRTLRKAGFSDYSQDLL